MSLVLPVSTWLVFAAAWAGLRDEERLQLTVPGMLEAGRRESAAILAVRGR